MQPGGARNPQRLRENYNKVFKLLEISLKCLSVDSIWKRSFNITQKRNAGGFCYHTLDHDAHLRCFRSKEGLILFTVCKQNFIPIRQDSAFTVYFLFLALNFLLGLTWWKHPPLFFKDGPMTEFQLEFLQFMFSLMKLLLLGTVSIKYVL